MLDEFTAGYYNIDYFITLNGKKFKREDGKEYGWSYSNTTGEWHGCKSITEVWKDVFGLTGSSKSLDIGCGRGTFIAYLVDLGINAQGFDFSEFSVNNLYSRCPKERVRRHDATLAWPYGDSVFDLVTALDIFEHLYLEDIDKVIDEMLRVTKKWVFLQIAGINGGSGAMIHDKCYILKRGEKISVRLEGMAVAGHVTVQTKEWWIDRLTKGIEKSGNKWKFRDDLISIFINKTPADVVSNWVKNIIIILERV